MNRRIKNAISTSKAIERTLSDRMIQKNIKVFEQNREEIIKKFGHMVQFVGGDRDTPPFAYTLGRSDRGLRDFVIPVLFGTGGFAQTVLNHVVENFDNGNLKIGQEFTIEPLTCVANGEFTKFRLTEAITGELIGKTYGILRRTSYNRFLKFWPLTVVVANSDNVLPSMEGRDEQVKRSKAFFGTLTKEAIANAEKECKAKEDLFHQNLKILKQSRYLKRFLKQVRHHKDFKDKVSFGIYGLGFLTDARIKTFRAAGK